MLRISQVNNTAYLQWCEVWVLSVVLWIVNILAFWRNILPSSTGFSLKVVVARSSKMLLPTHRTSQYHSPAYKNCVYYILQLDSYPTVLVAVFIEQPTPFLEEFLDKIYHIEYPMQKLHLFVHNSVRMPVHIIYTKCKSVCLVLHT